MNRIIATIDAAAIDGASQSSSHVIIRTKGGGAGADRFAFSFASPETFCRRVDNGPILSGPYLCGFGVSTCIHNGPVTANPIELHLQDGDVIRIRNLVERGHLREFDFKVTISRGYPKFECIAGKESKMQNRDRTLNIEPTEMTREEFSEYLKNK